MYGLHKAFQIFQMNPITGGAFLSGWAGRGPDGASAPPVPMLS